MKSNKNHKNEDFWGKIGAKAALTSWSFFVEIKSKTKTKTTTKLAEIVEETVYNLGGKSKIDLQKGQKNQK